MTSIFARRILANTGFILLASPADDAAMHHSLLGVAFVVAGSWLLSLCLVRGK